MLKTCQVAISKPNRNSLWRFGSAREQFRSPAMEKDKASSERQSKAAGRVLRALKVLRGLRLLRGVENVPDSNFEAQ